LEGVRYEIILVDDCSTDGTRELLCSLDSPRHRVHFNAERGNYAANCNVGARLARAEVLCLLNNDTRLTRGWWQPMLRALQEEAQAGIVGNVQINRRLRRYDHFGMVFAPDGMPVHFGQYFFFRPFRRGVREWSSVTTACAMVQRSVFLRNEGFDESFQNGCEDVDLCLRLRMQGYRHYVANESIIHHVKCASPGRRDFNKTNEALLLSRWGNRIRMVEARRDRHLFALTYSYRALVFPWTCRGRVFLRGLRNLVSWSSIEPGSPRRALP
jgi:hypothetical protein